jgi:hypothetical protein
MLLPADYPRIQRVHSFHELVTTPMQNGVNAMFWERTLVGDFREIVTHFGEGEGIVSLDDSDLLDLTLSAAGQAARDILLADLAALRSADLQPSLDCVYNTPRDESGGVFPVDVLSFHADSATVPADTYLCAYTEACSEGLRNDQAIRRVDVPETRAALLQLFGGEDGPAFEQFLNENYYDLHYVPLPGAEVFSFGLGNLWRIATDYPGNPVPPCVHRAPPFVPGRPPRLLLIS